MRVKKLSKTSRKNFLTYALVIVAYGILQSMQAAGSISSSLRL